MINEMAAAKAPEKPLTKQQLTMEWLANEGPCYEEEFDFLRQTLGISMNTIKKYPGIKWRKDKRGTLYYTDSSIDPTGRPMSRYESSGYGLNFRLVPRLEKIAYDVLKKSGLDDRQIHLWWNSTYARHWGDSFEDSFKYPTNASFRKTIKEKSDSGETGIDEVKRYVAQMESKGQTSTEESYHQSNVRGTILRYLREKFQKSTRNPKIDKWMAEKYGRQVVKIFFETDPREWNF
jgi:hypothetical protein